MSYRYITNMLQLLHITNVILLFHHCYVSVWLQKPEQQQEQQQQQQQFSNFKDRLRCFAVKNQNTNRIQGSSWS